ncbi:kinase-like domain-containing protein [Ilyonectria robusta]|uniref:kinase-like domain-containing protein n=1 Tax=Ilyonectria robusta TaxID=1079257 RepID=UPI001E8CC6DF|nr:kinase-like domain-containing protein [Ilyonectria robusta]XP_046094602.1 kinase-like domain-containing protein [Ilyonectria robusta]XP_046096175.1 kinase-like domain-containing protein [Ilyonectria robusta]KAH8654233.1 kinase-like domain-containing protein [Ilyonectria robusta]KAH8654888.1 kinase-like domain-containing protein [Ilyonectria robusta]KAH8661205.1 kinase-like domain-containing protein [Ilyonectria robusta]
MVLFFHGQFELHTTLLGLTFIRRSTDTARDQGLELSNVVARGTSCSSSLDDDTMSTLTAARQTQTHGLGQRPFDHEDFRPPLLLSDPPNPSLHHQTHPDSTSESSTSLRTAIQSPHPYHGSDRQLRSSQNKTRLPDWNEFYKNGLPQEIIVIEDTPEPCPDRPTDEPTSYHTTAPSIKPASTRKRKFDEEPVAQPQRPADEPYVEKSGARTVQPQRAEIRLPQPNSTPQLGSPDPRVNQKRKRTRYQLANGASTDIDARSLLGTNIEYKGLTKPVLRAKDVAVRVGHTGSRADNKKIDDDDGHYIVVPDEDLTSQLVAVKVIRSVQKYRDAAKIELRVLQTLRQNDAENKYRCIHLRDCFDFRGHTCLVMNLLDSSIFDYLKGNGFVPFPNSHIQSFAKQLLTSVAFVHDLGLIHTDLKPENILLCRQAEHRKVLLNPEIRLIDFGSATFQDEYHSSVVSTRHYRAPEIILGLGWSFPCDIWSIGCILVEFFTGDALFQTHDNVEHLALMEAVFDMKIDTELVRKVNRMSSRSNSAASYFKRFRLNYPTPETNRASRRFVRTMKRLDEIIPTKSNTFLKHFLDLLQKIFVYDPARRITAKEALNHPWFQEPVRDDGTEAARIRLERAQMFPHSSQTRL